ncbi:MAG: HD domain-containing protein [Desulfovibrio sp.]|jgi:(p)ppGpp synthase/HD superfamily hydrolase|nr:HD domain-containing protein [Desulfovibrio sp.]
MIKHKFKTSLTKMAWIFALHKLRNQDNIDRPDTDYISHNSAVVLALGPALLENMDLDVETAICCAILHNLLDETQTTKKQIEEFFGTDIAEGLSALSKDKSLPSDAAAIDTLERIKNLGKEIWLVKLADCIATLKELPDNSTSETRLAYISEAKAVLEELGGATPLLSRELANLLGVQSK